MRKFYNRTLRSETPPPWSEVSQAWRVLTGSEVTINFEALFAEVGTLFLQNPSEFTSLVRKSHHLPRGFPADFNSLNAEAKTACFFGQFRFIFSMEELRPFVCQANLQPESFRNHFSPATYILFHSVCYLYQSLLYSLKGTPLFAKHAPPLAFLFGKLLVPDGHRHLESTSFEAEYVFISPVLVTMETATKKPAFCLVDPSGLIVITDPSTDAPIVKIDQDVLTGVTEGEKLLFYDDGLKPVIEIVFPSVSSAYDAFTFSLTPPRPGFMQLSAFLHSVAAFETFTTFFPANLSGNLPEAFSKGIRKVLSAPSLEVMLYIFSLSSNESKVDQTNIGFFLDLIGDLLLPFLRVLTQLKWESTPYGGQLIMRQNSQYTVLCRMLLKLFAGEYAEQVQKEARRLLDENGAKIKQAPITDDSDAIAFLDYIFDPLIQFILSSKVPKICRVLHRLIFVRTAGFYVGQNASYLVIPNLFFLRFLIPPIAEETTMAYIQDPKMKRISSLLCGSLLSLCNGLGWPADKEPYMMNFLDRMERCYPRMDDFTFELIDCHEFEGYDPAKLSNKGNTIELIAQAAKRVILMNLKDPNKYIHSHIFSVSIMHMMEEFVYKFVAPAGGEGK
jgi:hypothetical protein